MTTIKTFIRITGLLLYIILTAACSAGSLKPDITLAGSTPADTLVKSMLTVPAETKVDFIRWNLLLDGKNSFVLDITYGESKPNTLGFKSDVKQIFTGTYQVIKNQESHFREIYQLRSDDLPEIISIVRITENLFHILTPQGKLMIGNGGWSYSLNRKTAVDQGDFLIASPELNDRSLQLVFEGRTPCREIASEHPEMKVSSSCFKLKWKLVLNRDSVTFLPATCTIRAVVDNQPRDITGRWTIIKGTATNEEAIFYKIQADHFADPILLFLGDENVLFFLDKNLNPFIGNEDFSYTMNRRI